MIAQFAAESHLGGTIRRSVPRRHPLSPLAGRFFDGLGGPAFYFYPPIAFWVDALLSVVDIQRAVGVVSPVALLAGAAVGVGARHARLAARRRRHRRARRSTAPSPTWPRPIICSITTIRGAFAEFAAYAVLPLVALAVRQIATGSARAGPVRGRLCGASDGASADGASHLGDGAAALCAVSRLAARRSEPAVGFFVRCALAGALGLGLASIYLVPALGLQDWIPADTFWMSYLPRRELVPADARSVGLRPST